MSTNPEIKIYENTTENEAIKEQLNTLVKAIDVKEQSSSSIDNLFKKLNSLDEDKKNLALQYALKEAPLTIGSGKKKLGEIAELFDRAVEQEESSRKIRLKADIQLSDEEKALIEPFLNEKESSLAYLIQTAWRFAKIQAQKGYGKESGNLINIGIDKILGNQTRRALSGLQDWIESDLTTIDDNKIKELTLRHVLAMKFISKELKEKIEASDNEAIKSLWKDEKYEIRNPYTNNYALEKSSKQKDAGSNEWKETVNFQWILHEVIRPKTIDEIPSIEQRDKSTKKLYLYGGYQFFNNGRAMYLKDKSMHQSTDVIRQIKDQNESIANKKNNLIKNFELKSYNGSNFFYKKEGYTGLYLINKNKLFYLGDDHGFKSFLWGKETNWQDSLNEDIWSGYKKEVLKNFFWLKKDSKQANRFSREWYKGSYAFDKEGNLYYSGADHGNLVLKNLAKGDRNNNRETAKIPEEIDYIEV